MCYLLTDFLIHLKPLELYRLKLTCHAFYQAITFNVFNTSIIKQIDKKLKQSLHDVYSFKQLLQQTQAYISGSFIIQCILNENYDSDIDIYVPLKYDTDMSLYQNYFNDAYCISDTRQYNPEDPPQPHNIVRVMTFSYKPMQDELLEGQPIKNHKPIQIIYVNQDDLSNYFEDTFDFDILKNVYHQHYVKIKNLNDIINKKCQFQWGPDQNVDKSMQRAYKYKERGFTIINTKSIHDFVHSIYVYHVKLIKEDFYTIVDGDLTLLQPISEYIYLTKDYYKKIPKYPKIKRSVNHNTNKCSHCYDPLYNNKYCIGCKEARWKLKKQFLKFEKLKNHHNLVQLFFGDYPNSISHYIHFCYPHQKCSVYWSWIPKHNKQYYLFIKND
jgi:hypothetical protein